MKTNLITSLKLILADRLMTVLLFVFIVACAAYCLYVSVSLRPSDLQVAVHYTAFGQTSFYREKWYYLLSFVMFGLILGVIHTLIIVKLYVQERRQIAILFTWFSFLLLLIAWVVTRSVLRIAFL
jgi:hypothetical protein